MDKNIQLLQKLYLVSNPFQLWAWILTALALLFLIPGTRRMGGIWFLVILACMGVFFGLQRMMNDFAPKDASLETPKATGRRRHR